MSDLSQLPFFVVFNSEDELAAVYEEEHACFARKLREGEIQARGRAIHRGNN